MLATSRSLADGLFEQLIDAFPPEQAYGRAAFTRPPMPEPIAHFLGQQLQRRHDRELRRLRKARSDAWFVYEHPDVRRAQQGFATALAQHVHFPQSRWKGALRRAIQDVAAYLIQPRQTLAAHVFAEDTPLTAAIVERRMGSFSPYPYLQEETRLFFKRRHIDRIDRERFEGLLRRIDREATAAFEPAEWLALLTPLFALVRLVSDDGVAVAALRAFFEEKREDEIVRRLEQAREEGTARLTEQALSELLAASPSPSEASEDTAWEQTGPPSMPPSAEPEPWSRDEARRAPMPDTPVRPTVPLRPAPPPDSETPPAKSSDAVPLWRQFQRGLQRPEAPEEAPRGFHALPDPAPKPDPTPAKPRWMQFHQSGEPSASEDKASVRPTAEKPAPERPPTHDETEALTVLERTVLGPSGPRNRDLFVEELFGNSTEAYVAVLQRLLGAPTWAEASHIIAADVFRTYGVNIYSDPAVLFTDAVELRYRR